MTTQDRINQILESPHKARMSAAILANDFKLFIKYFHYHINKQEFIFKPFHLDIIKALEDIALQKTDKNLIINLVPRYGKSIIVQYFTAWGFARNINSNYIYTSFSDTLVLSFSDKIRSVIESELFTALYKAKISKSEDSKRKWTIKNGGGIYAASQGGAITGFGAGHIGDDYAGALICFPYDEKVRTDKGLLKIGDIVHNKLDVRVYSYNHSTNLIELQPIDNYIINPEDDIVQIDYGVGEVKCTPNHKIFTKDAGYINASSLSNNNILFSLPKSFDLMYSYSELFRNIFSSIISIKNKIKFFFCEFFDRLRVVISKTFGLIFPIQTFFNTNNRSGFYRKFFSNIAYSTSMCSYFSSNIWSKLCARSHNTKGKTTMLNSIFHIIGFSAISKIIKVIVRGATIKVSNLYVRKLRSNKSMHNYLMNTKSFSYIIFSKVDIAISLIIYRFKHFFSKINKSSFRATTSSNSSRATYYISCIGNFIKTFITGKVSPNFVRVVGHSKNTYCLTIRGNHNMFVGKGQAILVKNCDDPIKPQDAKSEVIRQKCIDYYEETLSNRLNNPKKTPIIIIMQRLHQDDLCGHIIATDKDNWNILTIEAYNEDTGECIWPEKHDKKFFLNLRKRNPFYFYSQFQQQPIATGNAIYNIKKLKYYKTGEVQFDKILQSWDTAFKSGKENDYSVCITLGIKKTQFGEDYYLIDVWRKRAEYPELKREFKRLQNKFSPYIILVEDKGSGQSLLQDLEKEGNNRLRAVKADIDKVSRATAPSDMIYNGQLYLSEREPWLQDFISELRTFPNGKHDDQVDALNQALNYLNIPRGFIGVF